MGRKKRTPSSSAFVQTVPKSKAENNMLFSAYERQSRAERELYRSLRESVPIIDAAICKTVRLIGNFKIETEDKSFQELADEFTESVKVNGSSSGIINFIYTYLDSLLTYGEAVGEMVPDAYANGIYALYNASLDDVEIAAGASPLELRICRSDSTGIKDTEYPELVLATLLNQKPGTVRGTSLLSGLPFVSSILLRIFKSIKTNWERAGDVRFAVTYSPKTGESFSKENAALIAEEWKKAIRSDTVCDFVSLGDVSIKVIGADNQIPDCEIPVKTVMEQLVAKLGIPPFLLGLSWSSTERMSEQQADILTSELEFYRETLNPVIRKITQTHLRLAGCNSKFKILWNDINLQDTLELSHARLNNAQAAKLEKENNLEVSEYQNY